MQLVYVSKNKLTVPSHIIELVSGLKITCVWVTQPSLENDDPSFRRLSFFLLYFQTKKIYFHGSKL